MSLISDYIGERLKAGEDIPIPTMKLAAILSVGSFTHKEFIHNRYLIDWALKHETVFFECDKRPTPQYIEARRLAKLPFD
jgi:hypothetical protein